MGTGIMVFPIILILIYILPISLFFYKKLNKIFRIVILLIPIVFTAVSIISIVKASFKQASLYKQFPQVNKIVFKDSFANVRDSIKQLQILMSKLPKRLDHESVSYVIDKYPTRLNSFSFNWYDIGNLDQLEKQDSLQNYTIPSNKISEWKQYMGADIKPFHTFSKKEAKYFIRLIKYLDHNNLNAANLEDGIISFDYQDSLRMTANTGFRTIVLDKSRYYGDEAFDTIDSINGFFLLRKK